MKRLPQTLTAAVLTGALAFGGPAVAQAQIPDPVEDKPLTEMPTPTADEETGTEDAPVEEGESEFELHDAAGDPINVAGVDYFKQKDGS